MAGYQYPKWHIVRMRVPNDVYMPIYDSIPARHGRRYKNERDYVVLSKRFVELITKGLKFEEMEKRAGPLIAKKPVVSEKPDARFALDGPVCCQRPMVDYGEFWFCMIGGEKILK